MPRKLKSGIQLAATMARGSAEAWLAEAVVIHVLEAVRVGAVS